jgi:hypothetical protein
MLGVWWRLTVDNSLFFSADYFTARERFRTAARARGFRLTSYPLSPAEPWDHELTTDAAFGGSNQPARVAVVSSGLHGVEGFLGSALQLALLEGDPDLWQPPAGVALVLLHALNPFGFARLRRVNEDSVDLNRNFLTAANNETPAYQGCHSLYPQLDPLLNPRHPPRWYRPFLPYALLALLRYRGSDRTALRQAIAGGQYEFPKGLFFGGRGPSRTQQLLRQHLPDWIGGAKQILHLDVHTGLGPWGRLQLLLDASVSLERRQWLVERFGADVVSLPATAAAPAGDYYTAQGEIGGFCQRLFPDRLYDPICAEFGTYSAVKVLGALRAENQAHHWGHPDAAATRRARERLREVFAPADPGWRRDTVAQGIALVRRAFEVLRC